MTIEDSSGDLSEATAIALFGELLTSSSREAVLMFSNSDDRNAFTIPSLPPTIVVTRGLLRSLRGARSAEAVLRFVLAHEIGHVPHVARLRIAPIRSLILAGLALPFVALLVAMATGSPLLLFAGMICGPTLIIAAANIGARIDRRREMAADRFAIELTGDHAALPIALQILGGDGVYAMVGRRTWLDRMFDSHPSDEERVAQAARVGRRRESGRS